MKKTFDNFIILRPSLLCNWNCKYCGFSAHVSNDKMNIDDFLKYTRFLFKNYPNNYFNISGGEPGLIGAATINKVLKYKKQFNIKYLSIETNGKLFNFDNILFDEFDLIKFHPIQEVKDLNIRNFNYRDENNVQYVFVISQESNLRKLQKLLNHSNYFKTHTLEISPIFDLLTNIEFMYKLAIFLIKNKLYNLKFVSRDFRTQNINAAIQCVHNVKSLDILFSDNSFTQCCYLSHLDDSKIPLSFKNLQMYLENDYCVYNRFCFDTCIKYKYIENNNRYTKILDNVGLKI